MRKKYLLNQNTELLAVLENEHQKGKGLEMKNTELLSLLQSKDSELANLKQQLAESEQLCNNLQIKNHDLSRQVSELTEVKAAPPKPAEVFQPAPASPIEKITPVSPAICSTEAEQYGAKAIGRIAVKAAMLSNLLAASGDPNAHDLLTLTLGRTEVFKSEVLSAVRSHQDEKQIEEQINSLEKETAEYFDTIKGQLG